MRPGSHAVFLAFVSAAIPPARAQEPISPAIHDTLTITHRADPPALDGRISQHEYGDPSIRLPAGGGHVIVWLAQTPGWIHIAATLPDSSFYWGDDLVIGLDPDGSGGEHPGAGDRQWYLRRVLDSSVVIVSSGGLWQETRQESPRLGARRMNQNWELASSSTAASWSLELRIRDTVFQSGGAPARFALRTYNDQPAGWWSWPEPPDGVSAREVENRPSLWRVVRVKAGS